jgi:hypothetical protein
MGIIIEFIAQVISGIFFNKLSQRIPKRAKTWFNRFLYYYTSGMIGMTISALIFMVFPKPLISNSSLQAWNLFMAPILIGLILQNWHKKALGTKEFQIDAFLCGFLFSFCWLLFRFVAAQNSGNAITSS